MEASSERSVTSPSRSMSNLARKLTRSPPMARRPSLILFVDDGALAPAEVLELEEDDRLEHLVARLRRRVKLALIGRHRDDAEALRHAQRRLALAEHVRSVVRRDQRLLAVRLLQLHERLALLGTQRREAVLERALLGHLGRAPACM